MPQKHENTKYHKKEFTPISKELEYIGKQIVDVAYAAHKYLCFIVLCSDEIGFSVFVF